MRPVTQDWTHSLPLMQQTVLLTAVRGPDDLPKYHPAKYLLRWFRRCTLLSAIDRRAIDNPWEQAGGSFTGPSIDMSRENFTHDGEEGDLDWRPKMDGRVDAYLRGLDEVPHHFHLHLMHAAEILGYKHPDGRTRGWWHGVYLRLVNDMHLHPESEMEMDARLGDDRDGWLERADRATRE